MSRCVPRRRRRSGQLTYRNWVESRRAYVDSISGGRLGYVHIASMSEGALEQLIFDLDQQNHAKDGVVIDVRNNNGGFVNVYALDILSRRNYFTMQGRGSDVRAPSRVQLGQRALLSPTVLVTNQHTLSDGEDFTEGYRELELGQWSASRPPAGSSSPAAAAWWTARPCACPARSSATTAARTWS
jgi:tricorn protease